MAAVLEDPIKGWLENWYGATGISVFTAKGLNRVFLGHKSIIVDVIPADYVANLVIIAGARNNKYGLLFKFCFFFCPVLLSEVVVLILTEKMFV